MDHSPSSELFGLVKSSFIAGVYSDDVQVIYPAKLPSESISVAPVFIASSITNPVETAGSSFTSINIILPNKISAEPIKSTEVKEALPLIKTTRSNPVFLSQLPTFRFSDSILDSSEDYSEFSEALSVESTASTSRLTSSSSSVSATSSFSSSSTTVLSSISLTSSKPSQSSSVITSPSSVVSSTSSFVSFITPSSSSSSSTSSSTSSSSSSSNLPSSLSSRPSSLNPPSTSLLTLTTAAVSLSSGTPDAINVADDQLTNEQLTTQTVFGFGDYITTIGNTVMLFTPQGDPANSASNQEDDLPSSIIETTGLLEQGEKEIKPSSVLQKEETFEDEIEEILEEEEEEEEEGEQSTTALRFNGSDRKKVNASLKDRLKARYEKARKEEEARKSSGRQLTTKTSKTSKFAEKRGTSEPYFIYGENDDTEAPRPRTFRSRISRQRSTSRKEDVEVDDAVEVEDVEDDVASREGRQEFGQRRSSRPDRRQSFSSRKVSSTRERGFEPKRSDSRSSKPSFSRDRGSNTRIESIPLEESTPVQPKKSSPTSSFNPSVKKPKIEFKKFDRFDRPDIRKNLFNKFLNKRKPVVDKEEEEEEEEDETTPIEPESDGDHESSPSALVPSIITDEDILQNIDNDEIRLERLQTTLLVSTVFPLQDDDENSVVEVATIRSPYTFQLENQEKSTRFITVTRTFSKPVETSQPFTSIKPTRTQSVGSSSTPLFDTKSIPAPENILATSDYKEIIQGSHVTETLPPITLPSSLYGTQPSFKTVTETFSTDELMIKKSILPIIIGSETSLYTLSQTYEVTKHVTAVKTIPPLELYEFSPSKSFADIDALFQEAGSENREHLLPGELEFSDQDNFGLEGPAHIRVTPPPGFLDDLDLIGDKLDFVDHMEKQHNPEIFQLKNPANQIAPSRTIATPALQQLPSNPGFNISPEQLLYLQLLQNPLAALLGGGAAAIQPQVVTESTPVLRTETVYETNTIKLFQGAKEFTTLVTNVVGLTTITDYDYSTSTVAPGLGFGGISGLGNLGGLSGLNGLQGGLNLNNGDSPNNGGFLQPSFTVVSSPVIRNTVETQTFTQELKITFRNIPTLTTITSTSVVSTQVTSYVTRTQRVSPTANPFAGFLG
ncbi:cell wall protein DAN4 [Eurytemora carolleeae]|uniref:cell wall protein DAN4 n=1 Tax=Eurytemora carolleeae TaxID=1294199 RepID=UPI000C7649A5|nr:cell wall protein DAN4 [Eurytemora carolleeae]|eukprot:XP_023340559.1 cell wall protein DAN4-like [Eurytemora affinis]